MNRPGTNTVVVNDKMERLRKLVENKTARGSLLLAGSRLFSGEGDGNKDRIRELFARRRLEIEDMEKFTDKIKDYMHTNKRQLLKDKAQTEKEIAKIRMI